MGNVAVTLSDTPISTRTGSINGSGSLGQRRTFNYTKRGGRKPIIGESTNVYWMGHAIFGGTVEKVTTRRIAAGQVSCWYDVNAVSWEAAFDRRFIKARVYRGMTAGEIAQAVINEYCVGEQYSFAEVNDGASALDMGEFVILAKYVSEVLDDLAQRSNFLWWMDPNAGFHFVGKSDISAVTFDLTYENQNFTDFQIIDSRMDYANEGSILVAWDAVDQKSKKFTGDNVTREFKITDDYGNDVLVDHVVSIEVNGVAAQSIGVKETGSEGNYDWTYEYGGNTIIQDTALPALTPQDTVEVKFYELGANILSDRDYDEITARHTIENASSGIYHVHLDNSESKDKASSLKKLSGYFDTHCPGRNGADKGTVPVSYKIITNSYWDLASSIVPGAVINVNSYAPATPGTVTILVQTVGWQHRHSTALPETIDSGGDTTGFFEIEISGVDYVAVGNYTDYFNKLSQGSGGLLAAPSNLATKSVMITQAANTGQYLLDLTVSADTVIDVPTQSPNLGDIFKVMVTQDATGNHAIGFTNAFDLLGDVPALDPNTVTIFEFTYNTSGVWIRSNITVTGVTKK